MHAVIGRTEGSAAETAPFALRLLGPFRLTGADGETIMLPTRNTRLLLAYLALSPSERHARGRLAALFWPDRQDEQARGSLRNAIGALRTALGDAVEADRETVALVRGRIAVDADTVLRASGNGDADPLAMAEIGTDELLGGLTVDEGPLAEWLLFERARVKSAVQTVLHRAAKRLAETGRIADAVETAERLLALDPLRERSHRLLMRLDAQQGERSRALARYRTCAELLRRELGVEPSPETQRVAAEIGSATGEASGAPASGPRQPAEPQRRPAPPSARSFQLSLVVLPFRAHCGDAEQEHVAAGLAADVLTALARQREFIVIARQSSFGFAPGADPVAVARDHGVRYALSGSVRRCGARLRVNAILVDTALGRAVWAERYDREMGDLFAVQDDIAWRIVATVDAEMRLAERERVATASPEALDAWELCQKGLGHLYRFTREDLDAAEALFRRARELDPTFAGASSGLAFAALSRIGWRFTDDPGREVATGLAHAEDALALNPNEAQAAVVRGRLLVFAGRIDEAIAALEEALAINPNHPHVWLGLAQAHHWAGRPDEALPLIAEGERLNPRCPMIAMFKAMRALSLIRLDDFEGAVAASEEGAKLSPRECWCRLSLAVALAALGRSDEARAAVAEARRIDPTLTLAGLAAQLRHAPEDERERLIGRLAAAGLD